MGQPFSLLAAAPAMEFIDVGLYTGARTTRGEGTLRLLAVMGCAAALGLAGCDKSAQSVDTCVTPRLTAPADSRSYAGQRELAHACVKTAAYAIARDARAVDLVADAVFRQCAGKEADEIAALKRTGPVYPYQVTQIHEALVHLARISAIQARAKGCGLSPGERADSMLESKP